MPDEVNTRTLNEYRETLTAAKRRLSRMRKPPHYTVMRYMRVLTVTLNTIDGILAARRVGHYDHNINPIA